MNTSIVVIRLLLAILLSGLIGIEREFKSRPAGFRTHILVCVGSALVMMTSEYIFGIYHTMTNLDPTRLGAQVISGIGFLGAGTIIRQGNSIKGLTTAASLWAVACVGLAVGAGFYAGAISVSIIIYLTLFALNKFEKKLERKNSCISLCVTLNNEPGKIGEIGMLIGKHCGNIKDIDFINQEDNEGNEVTIRFVIKLSNNFNQDELINEIAEIQGIKSVEIL